MIGPRLTLTPSRSLVLVMAAAFVPYLPDRAAGIQRNVIGYGGLRGIRLRELPSR